MFRKSLSTLVLFASLNAASLAAQPTLEEAIADVGHRWAKVTYQTPEPEKEAAFNTLIANAQQLSQSFPGKAEPLIWQAIILASAAKAEGGLGALSKVKEARDLLLAAEMINPSALNGSVYNSLGSLYAKVPGWPIGFGDKKKAKEYFERVSLPRPSPWRATRSLRSVRAWPSRGDTNWSHRTSLPAPPAKRRSSRRRTGAIAIPSPTAPTAGPGSPSSKTSPMTGP